MALKTTPPFLSRIVAWIKTHRTRTFIIVGAFLIIVAGAIAAAILLQPPIELPTAQTATPRPIPPKKYYSPLTGEQVPDEATTKAAVTAIMIENSPDARPQSGIKQAGVVYEAIAEGGITRFLALYQQAKPQLIGPVRSLRMYYVDWLAPYNASIAHIGGSAAALAEVRNGSYRDIDQFFNDAYYWRAADRYAPHNVYTSFAKLDELNASKGYTESVFQGFARTNGDPAAEPTATQVTIDVSGPLFNAAYTYDATSNTYLRSQAGAPHTDREEGQIAPSAVVAMMVDMVHIQEDGYRESIATTGTGRAVIFQNGIATEATWRKSDRATPLTFTDADGKEIPLIRGQTWITAVPNQSGGVSWQ